MQIVAVATPDPDDTTRLESLSKAQAVEALEYAELYPEETETAVLDHILNPPEFTEVEVRWLAWLIVCSFALGVAVNTASLLVIQSRSSLFMKSLVIVRNIGLVFWGVIFYDEQVSALEVGGCKSTSNLPSCL